MESGKYDWAHQAMAYWPDRVKAAYRTNKSFAIAHGLEKRLTQSRKDAKGEWMMTENEVARIVVDAAYQVHTRLGPGLLESVYEVVLEHEIKKRGLRVCRQRPVSIEYDDLRISEAFRADLDVEDLVMIELKSVEQVLLVHKKQLLTYLRLSDHKLGLLINFGSPLIKQGIQRIVNGLDE